MLFIYLLNYSTNVSVALLKVDKERFDAHGHTDQTSDLYKLFTMHCKTNVVHHVPRQSCR